MRRPERRERQAQHLLGAGLADRAGDGDDRAAACARAPPRRSARARRADRPARRAADPRPPAPRPSLHDRQRRAGLQRRARRSRGRRSGRRGWRRRHRPARCVRLSMEMPVIAGGASPCEPSAGRRDEMPRWSRAALMRAPPTARQRSARLLLVGEGQHLVADVWPVSWPLPAMSSTSPAREPGDGRADRLAAVADLARARRAAAGPPCGSRPDPRCADCRR